MHGDKYSENYNMCHCNLICCWLLGWGGFCVFYQGNGSCPNIHCGCMFAFSYFEIWTSSKQAGPYLLTNKYMTETRWCKGNSACIQQGRSGVQILPRRILFWSPSCVHRGWRVSWWQISYPVIHLYRYIVVVNECTDIYVLGHWNLW